ncbi:MAG TPA: hypothetical protein VFW44_16305 [Bryobacteraceae bacterium]|nr:hypothetical protein [Bryobacteraceae bacterium]
MGSGGYSKYVLLGLLPLTLSGGRREAATVARQGFRITTPEGSAIEPLLLSLDWSKPQPRITRAVVIFHGKGRDVEGYYQTALDAGARAGSLGRDTVFIAPQFLDEEDARVHQLPPDVLRWRGTAWEAGASAIGPIKASSFDVVDAVLARLADRSAFPNLKVIVLAGHSGGAQLLQRFAVAGHVPAALERSGSLHLRFVIANPSSYLYFTGQRPALPGAAYSSVAENCPAFNHWKYGVEQAPRYVVAGGEPDWQQIEEAFARRDVVYLLGTEDVDPHEPDLDVSCGGEAQGRTRLERGQAYYEYLHARHRDTWNQRLWLVRGVAHSAHKMFTAACGVDALFDTASCEPR